MVGVRSGRRPGCASADRRGALPRQTAGARFETARDSMLAAWLAGPLIADERSRAVNLQDIADRAGVSLATASRVLGNGSRRVSGELIERVTRAADDLGYSANLPARTVATGRSDIVGVLVHDISDPYFSTIATAVVQRADQHAAVVSIGNAFGDARPRVRLRDDDALDARARGDHRGQPQR